ncbi:extracellular solute-binding protein [Paenibacillus sp. FSL R5-0517]|uniref:extracellular solute-binding protein n=1 Tax=Paenibacillus sp. FSL R5-0517 TaxID=2921647 RepID=UPI0030DA3ECA
MKKKVFQKAGLISAALLLVLSTVGCNTNGIGNTDNKTPNLTIYTQSATYEGAVGGYMGKVMKDKLNVSLNVMPNSVGGSSRFETKMATGNLGDMVLFTSSDDFKKAIEAGSVLDLKEDLDQMPNVSRFKEAITRMEDSFGGVYGIPTGVSDVNNVTQLDPVSIPSLRFDYYQELGTPEIKEYWDYYDVIKKMVEAHPTTENGDKFYGMSLFSEWDGRSVNMAKQIALSYGFTSTDGVNSYDFIMPHGTEDKIEKILDENSYYLQALKWYNKFYQNGMLDEDSVSQTWEDYLAKANKGQSALWVYGYMGTLNYNPSNLEMVKRGKGYKRIPFSNLMASEAKTSTVGGRWFWAISSTSENKEASIKVLDYFYSDEGALNYHLGPEGLFWQKNDKGEPELTELGKSPVDSVVPDEFGGGKTGDTFKYMFNGAALDENTINSTIKAPMNKTTWKSYLQDNAELLDQNWTEHYEGALSAKEYLLKNNMLASYTVVNVPNFKYDDQLAVKRDQVGEIIKELSWKMIYARNDAEFSSLQAEMIQKAKSLGYDECVVFEEQAARAWFEARKAAK